MLQPKAGILGNPLRNAHEIRDILSSSQANRFPVRPNPAATSSAINNSPYSCYLPDSIAHPEVEESFQQPLNKRFNDYGAGFFMMFLNNLSKASTHAIPQVLPEFHGDTGNNR